MEETMTTETKFPNVTLTFLSIVKNDFGQQLFTTMDKEELIGKFTDLVNAVDGDVVRLVVNIKKRKSDGKAFGVLNIDTGKAMKKSEGKAVTKKDVDFNDVV
jgi:hypothetical protein